MELKQLQSFVAVVEYKSFTKAAQQLYLSQPTISAHIRMLEEELRSPLITRTTKSIEVTPRGLELYECASTILNLKDNLIQRWSSEENKIIHLGASTIPSAYILPEILPEYGKLHSEVYFVIHQSDSQKITEGLLNGSFDLGLIGMDCENESLACVPFYRDHMVLITPVNEHFLARKEQGPVDLQILLQEPMILREQGSGSKKSADYFLDSIGLQESDLKVAARINDQESIKNLVAGGFGISIISERAAQNFVKEKRLLMFELPEPAAARNLYLVYKKNDTGKKYILDFIHYLTKYYFSICP